MTFQVKLPLVAPVTANAVFFCAWEEDENKRAAMAKEGTIFFIKVVLITTKL